MICALLVPDAIWIRASIVRSWSPGFGTYTVQRMGGGTILVPCALPSSRFANSIEPLAKLPILEIFIALEACQSTFCVWIIRLAGISKVRKFP